MVWWHHCWCLALIIFVPSLSSLLFFSWPHVTMPTWKKCQIINNYEKKSIIICLIKGKQGKKKEDWKHRTINHELDKSSHLYIITFPGDMNTIIIIFCKQLLPLFSSNSLGSLTLWVSFGAVHKLSKSKLSSVYNCPE